MSKTAASTETPDVIADKLANFGWYFLDQVMGANNAHSWFRGLVDAKTKSQIPVFHRKQIGRVFQAIANVAINRSVRRVIIDGANPALRQTDPIALRVAQITRQTSRPYYRLLWEVSPHVVQLRDVSRHFGNLVTGLYRHGVVPARDAAARLVLQDALATTSSFKSLVGCATWRQLVEEHFAGRPDYVRDALLAAVEKGNESPTAISPTDVLFEDEARSLLERSADALEGVGRQAVQNAIASLDGSTRGFSGLSLSHAS